MNQMKKLISAVTIVAILSYVLFATEDRLTRIVVVPFLTFALAFLLQNVFLILGKEKLAAIMGKVYAIAFSVYWFGFLFVWDYLCIVRKQYVLLLVSLLLWFGGGYMIYRRLKRKS